MTDLQKVVAFRKMLTGSMTGFLAAHGYELSGSGFDGPEPDRVFKLVFSGTDTLQISNSDWRDYLEYFDVHVNGNEIFSINILTFPTLEAAFEQLKARLHESLRAGK